MNKIIVNPQIIEYLRKKYPDFTEVRHDEESAAYLVKRVKYSDKVIGGAKIFAICFPNNYYRGRADIYKLNEEYDNSINTGVNSFLDYLHLNSK